LKPTAKFSRRYATMGIPIRRVWRLPVRDAADTGMPGIRGLKPTPQFNRRYATGDDCGDAAIRGLKPTLNSTVATRQV